MMCIHQTSFDRVAKTTNTWIDSIINLYCLLLGGFVLSGIRDHENQT